MHILEKLARRWGPAAAVMAVIFWVSSTPGQDLPAFGAWDLLVKKGGHAAGYALLGAAYLWALAGRRPTGRAVLGAAALALLYSATDELHQTLTPGRHPSVADVGIDAAGAVLGAWLFWRGSGRGGAGVSRGG